MDLSTLPAIGYASRADAIRRRLSERGLNALAVSDMTNLRWLTGFTGSSALVVLLPDRLVLVTDGRYADRAQAEMAAAGVDAEIRVGFTQASSTTCSSTCAQAPARSAPMPPSSAINAGRRGRRRSTIVPADGVVEDARRVKDAGEVARIAAAAGCADRALADVAPMLGRPNDRSRCANRARVPHAPARCGRAELRHDRRLGAASRGPASPPGGRPPIEEGDTVVIDVGALVDGYHSDMTRNFVVGEPSRSSSASTTSSSMPSSPVSRPSAPGIGRARSTPRAATSSPRPATTTGTCIRRGTVSAC